MNKITELWEILVPGNWSDRKDSPEIPVSWHNDWDLKVKKITGGLTIMKPAKGIWQSATGEVVTESVIPVRIACSEFEIEIIAEITKSHYNQEAVMYYRVSNYAVISTNNNWTGGRVA